MTGTEMNNNILVFYYPEEGASNIIRLYTIQDTTVNGNDFSEYEFLPSNSSPAFNGCLKNRPITSGVEKMGDSYF